jgi:hypothetical protein
MFLHVTDHGVIEGGENEGAQFAEGTFLVIAEDPLTPVDARTPEIRAMVFDNVRLEQMGHYMAGEVVISEGDEVLGKIGLSGPYGCDGMPVRLQGNETIIATQVWSKMHPIPSAVVAAFWTENERFVIEWGRAHARELASWVIEAEYTSEDKEDGQPKEA